MCVEPVEVTDRDKLIELYKRGIASIGIYFKLL